MNVKQAAERLEVSRSLIYSMIARGRLRCYRIGNGRGAIRIGDEHVAEFLEGAEPGMRSCPAPSPVRAVTLKHLRPG